MAEDGVVVDDLPKNVFVDESWSFWEQDDTSKVL